jgi:hypothetical protein
MATTRLQDIKSSPVSKRRPVGVQNPVYAATGLVYFSDPIVEFETPRVRPDARGTISNERLKELAKLYQPPRAWREGEEEQVF